jgi:hypothetical protein
MLQPVRRGVYPRLSSAAAVPGLPESNLMTDPPSILQALQSIKAAMDIAKGLTAAGSSFEKAELKMKIAELAELLVNARMAALDAQEQIGQLEAKIVELQKAKDVRDKLVARDGVYYVKDGETTSGPYCVRCFETDAKLMPVRELSPAFQEIGKYKCPQCRAVY